MKTKIFAICAELQKSGVKPTLERVREALGGGSFSTINPILKEWKEQQSTHEQPALELPPEAVQAVSQAAALIWKIATDKSTELTNSLKHEFDTLLKEAVTEKEEALKEIALLEQLNAKLRGELEKQAKENQSLLLQVQKQQLALDASEGKAVELKEEMKTLRSDLREASNEAAMLQGKLSVYEKNILNV
jgi:predicted RNase H-like nuclease (RuvC/YqgF family)